MTTSLFFNSVSGIASKRSATIENINSSSANLFKLCNKQQLEKFLSESLTCVRLPYIIIITPVKFTKFHLLQTKNKNLNIINFYAQQSVVCICAIFLIVTN